MERECLATGYCVRVVGGGAESCVWDCVSRALHGGKEQEEKEGWTVEESGVGRTGGGKEWKAGVWSDGPWWVLQA